MSIRLLALVLAPLLLACGSPAPEPGAVDTPPPDTAEASPENPDLVAGEHVWTTGDGVSVPYTVAGEEDPTVMLVHCWMCDRTFWAEQVPVLAERYRTIALDLPGHGEAGEDRETWTVGAYGEDVAGLLEHLDLDDVVLVGHSMGGPVSLRAAALAGDRVRGVVAVDTLHDAEFDFSGEGVEQMMQSFENDFVATCENFVGQMFPEPGAEEIAASVKESSCREDRAQIGVALMRDFGEIPMEEWFEEADVPIRAVNAAAPNPTEIETNRKYADFDAVLMEGVGHYLHMSRPEDFNPLLLEQIEAVLAASASEATTQ